MPTHLAYALVVAHVTFGDLQSAASPWFALVVVASVVLLVGLHLAAGIAQSRARGGRRRRHRRDG